jgi:hypothetical protein
MCDAADSLALAQFFSLYHKIDTMSDDKNQRGGPDRGRVAGGEEWEIRYMMDKYKVTGDEVQAAIKSVGNSREKVEEYLQKRSSRKN